MKHIMIVEDNTQLLELYNEALSKAGYTVTTLSDASKATAALQENHPDLIVLDIMLPGGKNGFDILEEIKKNPQTSAIPVIILTNLDSEEKVAREIGAIDYLVKSNFSISQVVERIKAVLEQ